MAVSYWEWLNRHKALSCCLGLFLLSCFESVSQITWRKTWKIYEVLSARHSVVISKVLAARMRKLITARARKNKRTARMLANARKDHSIPLIGKLADLSRDERNETDQKLLELGNPRLDYQPLFGKGARAPPPNSSRGG